MLLIKYACLISMKLFINAKLKFLLYSSTGLLYMLLFKMVMLSQ